MKLSYVSISNYRSITTAHKIDLTNLTVLLAKNNEGKTNVLRAINLGMNILRSMDLLKLRKYIPKQMYDWREDFPLDLQNSKRLKNKNTTIRMDFTLDNTETAELNNIINANINGALSIYISIGEKNSLSITVPKRGKNAKALSDKIFQISEFICNKFDVLYIPAVRSETDAYNAISDLVNSELSGIDDQKYKESLEYIKKVQQERLNSLAERVITPLKKLMPKIKSVNLLMSDRFRNENHLARKNLSIDINDGVLTSLSNKGDGVKSLFTIAMLSQISKIRNRLIIVDEPENHLHPDAVRYICGVLNDLANENQVLISTHSPIFVNRNNVSSNIIVEGGKTKKADRIDTIRQTLGVVCSDNLVYSDYVVVVEGSTDRTFLEKAFREDEYIRKCIDSRILTIRSIGGTNNLKSEVYALQRFCCNYLIILDYDNAGKAAALDVKQKLSVSEDKMRYFMRPRSVETELEDLYKPDIYKDYLLVSGLDISNPAFKNRSVKWSERLRTIGESAGRIIDQEVMDEYKMRAVSLIGNPINDYLTENGIGQLKSICLKVKKDLEGMSLNRET